jgi:tetratricopeptide (TPR) repeat protein
LGRERVRATLLILTLSLMSNPETLPDFDKLWDYNEPAATEEKFRGLLPRAEAAGDASYRAQLLTQIARAQGLQRKFAEAHATLDQVGQVDQPLPRVRYLLERGRVFNSSGKPAEARPLFEQALEMASQNKLDNYAVDAAHMIAIVEPDPRKQLEWNLRAMDLAERSTDERARRWRASLYNNIGWTCFDQKDYDRAMEVFEKAVALRRQQDQPRELRVARYCVAKTLRMQGKLDDAIAIDRQIIEEAQAANEPDGYLFEELAECLHAQGKTDDAQPYFRRAYEELSKDLWLAEREPQRLERLKQLGS